jgi:SNF2 family DNA or RNA helicase
MSCSRNAPHSKDFSMQIKFNQQVENQELDFKTLRSRFEKCTNTEQKIVLLLSLNHFPISRSLLLKCLVKLDVKNTKGTRFQFETLIPILDKLKELSLIDSSEYPTANRNFENYALQLASESNHLESIADALEKMEESGHILTEKSLKREAKKLRDTRLAFFLKDYDTLEKIFLEVKQELKKPYRLKRKFDDFFQIVSQKPFKGELPNLIKYYYMNQKLLKSIITLAPCDAELREFQSIYDKAKEFPQEYVMTLALHYLYRGQFDEARALLSHSNNYEALFLNGWIAYLTGKGDDAIEYYQTALTSEKGFQNECINVGLCFYLAELLRRDTSDSFDQIKNTKQVIRDIKIPSWLLNIAEIFEIAIQKRMDPSNKPTFHKLRTKYDYMYNIQNYPVIIDLFSALGTSWFKGDYFDHSSFYNLFQKARNSGYSWFAAELAKILIHSNKEINPDINTELSHAISDLTQQGMKVFLFDTLNKQVNWRRAIDKLLDISPIEKPSKPKPNKVKKTSSRLVWMLSIAKGRCELKPKEQKLSNNGKWSKGRPVALKRLKDDAITMRFLNSQDAKISSDITVETYFSYGHQKLNYILDTPKALKNLVGHPYVFMEDAPTVPVEIVKKSPELCIERTDNALKVSIYPVTNGNQDYFVVQKSDIQINLYLFDENHKNIATYLQEDIAVPLSEKKSVHQLIDKLSTMVTIHSDLTDFKGKTTDVNADKTPHIQLQPYGNGLKMNIRVRPFKKQGPYYAPGMGGKTVIATVKRKNIQTIRDLQAEQDTAKSLISNCPSLAETDNGRWEWIFDEMDQALNMLLEIENLKNKPVVEWPEGKPITVSKPLSINSMTFAIQKKTDWFETDGQLQIDEDKTILFRNLLDLVESSPGNFIPLDDHRFLALTDMFRRQLEAFNAFCQKTKKGAKIHRLAALALGDFFKDAKEVKADKHWKNHLKRLDEGLNYQPEMPSTFRGELRSYQLEGVQWLMRLAYWQVGACLADDMGLGKTIQALAFILSCAHEGPVLVVAPSSVTFNWMREIKRFAPTLNPKLLTGKNRKKRIENLKPFDLLICSYALLVIESEHLQNVSWRVILLDEAQAIKNAETRRYQSAMALKGDFKIIMTGTPIENHLGELWNLFQFINPGLLQTRKKFNAQFVSPMDQKENRKKHLALKKLIKPFILRRLKSQVIDELPAKTEIILEVVQSEEEMALYEAMRRQALEKIHNDQKGQQSIQILAEIMRLRRACCHPRLVLPESQIESSKLTLVGNVLKELLENNHKALIFSQFVGYLTIVRAYLDQQKISYQYLDGKTPVSKRQKSIDAFQAGDGSVFLISLKAGGTGLNLTAADYVLHLDPWWNPAVEDQATDRAHRIGQQRPVTVYKFVTQHTIEQKILQLHHNKRNLAQDLLSGTDMTGKMSNEELLRLIES